MNPLPESEPPKLINDWEQVEKYGSLVILFASIPAIGLPGLVAKLLHVDEVLSLWQLIVATAPLTVAATVVGIVFLSKKYG